MPPEMTLFVYRIALANREWHARVISCDMPSIIYGPHELWPTDEPLKIYENKTARQLRFRVPVTDVIPYDPIPGSEAIYEAEDFIKIADREDRPFLHAAPNGNTIIIEGDCGDLELPFFLTMGCPTQPAVFTRTVSIQIKDVRELPDVAEYDERMEHLARTGDKYARMLHPNVAHTIPLPLGVFLPGTLCLRDGRETTVVYKIEEWLPPPLANIFLHCADSALPGSTSGLLVWPLATVTLHCADGAVEPASGSFLVRRRRSQDGVFRQCRVGQLL